MAANEGTHIHTYVQREMGFLCIELIDYSLKTTLPEFNFNAEKSQREWKRTTWSGPEMLITEIFGKNKPDSPRAGSEKCAFYLQFNVQILGKQICCECDDNVTIKFNGH